jgi:hypothetical protein
MCPVVCRCGMPWDTVCLSVTLGTGEVGVQKCVKVKKNRQREV